MMVACSDGVSDGLPLDVNRFDGVKTQVNIDSGRFTPEALWALGRLGDYAVAPDGQQLACVVTWYSAKKNSSIAELYVYPCDGAEGTRLLQLEAACYNLAWGEDGLIRFIATHEGSPQIYSIRPNGKRLSRISDIPTGVDGFKISPDGSHILYISTIQALPTTADRHPDLPQTTGILYTDLMYRHWDRWDDGTRSHLFVAPITKDRIGDAIDIMDGEPYDSPLKPFGGIEEVNWSHDGSSIAYTCKKLSGKEAAFSTNSDIYLYSLADGTTTNLTPDNPGYDRCPVFSPDGKYMAWLSMARAGFEADKDRLMLLDRATGAVREMTQQFDYSASGLTWTPDAQGLYFVAGYRGTSQIFYQGITDPMPRAITEGRHDYHSVALAGDQLIADRVSMIAPADLYRVTPESGQAQMITSINSNILQQITMPQVRERWITTTDGKQMLTWVLLPPHFDSTQRYPALLYCEGGPQSSLSQFWSYRWNLALMASQGYVIIAPNRRGVLTFGQEWTDAISKDHGGQEMRDLLVAIDELAREPWIDENRLGAVGASYGGFTVNWLAGHHQKRFKAFISHCGIFHSEMEFYTTEELFFDEWEMGGKPWDKNNATAQKSFAQSPHLFVEQWDTPIMIIHGGHDYRIPYTQGMAAFNAAQMLGIPSQFLYFPDESHWVLKPQNGLLWQREFFAWLDRYLKK